MASNKLFVVVLISGLLILGAVVEPTEAVCTVACVKGAYIRCRNYPRQQLYGCACHCAPPDGKRCVVHLPDRKAQRCWKRGTSDTGSGG
ncbi:hypothetical protein QOZ80_3AG0217400 [Eleusine coracana subsp. coracana]|nr:hypothetical protein QOZ80_3AG0217400 [Eleusine coracana subsp. coracana]